MNFLQPEIDQLEGAENRWRGRAEFTGEEPFFRDHFPGYPLVPGVLLLESLRVTAEKALSQIGRSARLAAISRVRFIQPVTPPAELVTVVSLSEKDPFQVKAELLNANDEKAATATFRFVGFEEVG